MCLLACLWITAPRCLSPSLGSFYSFSVSCFLSLTSRTLSILLVSSVPCNQTLALFLFYSIAVMDFMFSFVLILLNNPLSVSFLSRSCWHPAVRMTSPADERPSASSEWGEINADQSFIIPPKGATLSNHSTSRLLSGQHWKSLQFQNSTRQNSHSELCQRKTTLLPKKKKTNLHIIYFINWLTFIHSIIQEYYKPWWVSSFGGVGLNWSFGQSHMNPCWTCGSQRCPEKTPNSGVRPLLDVKSCLIPSTELVRLCG